MDKKRETLSDIMQSVRSWSEDMSDLLGYPCDMSGMCVAASVELFNRLSTAGIGCRIAVNDSHAFVLYGTSVLDVTASQFGKPDICVAHVVSEDYWKVVKLFDDVHEFEDYLSTWNIPTSL